MLRARRPHPALWVIASLGIVGLLSTGCAQVPSRPAEPFASHLQPRATLAACARFFDALDRTVREAGVHDAQAAPVAGFPYLRVDRFLASFRHTLRRPGTFEAWVDRLQALDREARRVEIMNLPRAARARLAWGPSVRQLSARVRRCGRRLRGADLDDPHARAELRVRATVPDEYQRFKRVLGVYPISAWLVLQGVKDWHRETKEAFARSPTEHPATGQSVAYGPARPATAMSAREVARVVARSAANPLRIPRPKGSAKARLLAHFAPVFQADVSSRADRIGRPVWRGGATPVIDTSEPRVYTRLSHTRLRGRVLLQLNYQIWFPARPASGPLDILAGHLDGITWRVTLAPDGKPLAYEAVHNCGCYYMLFPRQGLGIREQGWLQEPVLVPRRLPALSTAGRPVLEIEHSTHYLVGLHATTQGGGAERRYRLRAYAALRALPEAGGGTRSLFGPAGIVPGSQRAERWLLWPMGIPAPGEMRQWGHHAIAFVGRRHFDDPYLLAILLE